MLPRAHRALTRILPACFIVLLFAGARQRETKTLKAALDRAIERAPELSGAFLGIHVVRLSDGKVLYARNADHRFVPASNAKLFTLALALERLGPDYRFTTSVLSEPDGGLTLVGGGDPSLSGRVYPYAKDAAPGNPLAAIEDLADQISAHVKSVAGDVRGDDTRYPFQPYPGGWTLEDGLRSYGAPVSALALNDNSLRLEIEPGEEEGLLAGITLAPPVEFITFDNRVRTVAAGGAREIHAGGVPGESEIQLWGAVPVGGPPDTEALAVPDPALFAAEALRDALIRRGIPVQGRATAVHRFRDDQGRPARLGIEIAKRISPPLIQILEVTAKVSQNLHAEMLLREVGLMRRNSGTLEAGLAELREFLSEAQVPPEDYRFTDGSGLSRDTLVSPEAITALLEFMDRSPLSAAWRSLLPVPGAEGTLEDRFPGHREAAAIHAKTGSMGHVRALSGYADSHSWGRLAFSIIVDNYAAPDGEIEGFLDTIGLKLLSSR